MNKIDFIKSQFGNYYDGVYEKMGKGEVLVQHPVYGGRQTHCRSTMHTLVRMLKPTNVLEIGSWTYECADIMSLAFEYDYRKGVVDTFDIVSGGYSMGPEKPKGKFVNAHFWMPHHTGYDTWKYSARVKYPEFINLTNEEIFEFNKNILLGLGRKYDLILIDGDHSYEGAGFDFEYAKLVANPDAVIVVDDLYDERHWQVRKFYDELPYYKYDFRDWNNSGKDLISMGVFQCN